MMHCSIYKFILHTIYFRCDICPKTFVTSGGLRYHMKVKHAQVKDELLREDGNTEIDSSTSDKM